MSCLVCVFCLTLALETTSETVGYAWNWVPTEEDIRRYRQSWNPLSNGPIFISGVDIHPTGQFTVHPFIFSQISEKRFGNDLTVDSQPSPVHTYQIAPVVTMAYGLTNHLELNVGLSGSFWWARSTAQLNQGHGGPWTTDSGMGDTQIYLKYRPIVQDPDGWRPSVTTFNMIVLPTSRWITGSESPPGGFAIRIAHLDRGRHVAQEPPALSSQRRRVLLLSLSRK